MSLAIAFLAALPAQATDKTWVGEESIVLWTDDSGWSPSGDPTSSDKAIFDSPLGLCFVWHATATHEAESIEISDATYMDTLVILVGTLDVTNDILVGCSADEAELVFDNSSADATVNVGGDLYVGYDSGSTGTVTVDRWSGSYDALLAVTDDIYIGSRSGAEGTLEVEDDSTVTADDIYIGRNSGQGLLRISASTAKVDATDEVRVAADNGTDDTVEITAGELEAASLIIESGGTVDFDGGTLDVNTITIQSGGTLDLEDYLLFGDDITIDGTLTAPNCLALNFGATCEGHGDVIGYISNTSGTVNPGNADDDKTGSLTFTGLFLNSSFGGTLEIELAGTSSSSYDQIIVIDDEGIYGGLANLGGTLTVTCLGTFSPQLDDSFTIMTFAERTGTFGTENLPSLAGGLDWDVTYGATTLVLTVVSD